MTLPGRWWRQRRRRPEQEWRYSRATAERSSAFGRRVNDVPPERGWCWWPSARREVQCTSPADRATRNRYAGRRRSNRSASASHRWPAESRSEPPHPGSGPALVDIRTTATRCRRTTWNTQRRWRTCNAANETRTISNRQLLNYVGGFFRKQVRALRITTWMALDD